MILPLCDDGGREKGAINSNQRTRIGGDLVVGPRTDRALRAFSLPLSLFVPDFRHCSGGGPLKSCRQTAREEGNDREAGRERQAN